MTDKPITLTARQLAARHSEAAKARAFEWLRNLAAIDSAPEAGIALDTWADLADRALNATAQGMWQPIETAPKNPIKRVLLRWVSGQSEWICIGAWASAEDSPRLKIAGCPREGWMPDAGTCIPRNQKDCVGWMRLPSAAATPAVDAVAGEPVTRFTQDSAGVFLVDQMNQWGFKMPREAFKAIVYALTTPPRAGSETTASATCVGDTRFDGWLGCHEPDRTDGRRPTYTKQDMRDAYWAGYTERPTAPGQGVMGAEVVATDRPSGDWYRGKIMSGPDEDTMVGPAFSAFDPIRAALLVMLHEARQLNMHVLRQAGIGPFDLNAIRQAEAALATPSAPSQGGAE
jgi:hypothetical protein